MPCVSTIDSIVDCRIYCIFPHCLIKTDYFLKKKRFFEYKMRVLFSQKFFSETFHILRRTEVDIIVNIIRYSWYVLVIFLDLNFRKILKQNFNKILSNGGCVPYGWK
jgi:hypothetical protein